MSIMEPMFFTTPVPLIAGVVSKLNQGTNRQKGRHFLSACPDDFGRVFLFLFWTSKKEN